MAFIGMEINKQRYTMLFGCTSSSVKYKNYAWLIIWLLILDVSLENVLEQKTKMESETLPDVLTSSTKR